MGEAHKTQMTRLLVLLEVLVTGRETVELWKPGLEDSEAMMVLDFGV